MIGACVTRPSPIRWGLGMRIYQCEWEQGDYVCLFSTLALAPTKILGTRLVGTSTIMCFQINKLETEHYDVLDFIHQLTASQSNGDVRLANMSTTNSGRLEIFLRGTWGTICYDGFTKGAALAACRQLGYYDVLNYGTVRNLGWVYMRYLQSSRSDHFQCEESSRYEHKVRKKTSVIRAGKRHL